ncbi:DUF4238 domain-containing protein [Sporosarcina sp. P17b]|uniref:DUF4238 domain-containing protein n=1 Tax=Sporosarcina sp. P17b TaxID=2048260 RepID=UPI000C1727CD|nr:DUF4238 domain-containing protein [Sporosarcina sp. P17b]PIC72516.1 hypothetical protein CSV76_14900 [Sporosarcina sp. P17b]
MSRVKREHYVPQSYLIAFANEKCQVNVFDKSTQKKFISHIDKVAAEGKYFHFENFDINNEAVKTMNDEQLIEKFFSTAIEGEYKQILDRIRSRITLTNEPTFKVAITDEEKQKLAVFLTVQMLRVKDFRQTLKSISEKFTQAISENDTFSEKKSEFLNEINSLDEKVTQASMIFDTDTIRDFTEVILNHSWIFYFNTSDVDFITSDNPIVRNAHLQDPPRSYGGIASKGVEINFPISPKILLAMYEKSYHQDLVPCDNRIIMLSDNRFVDYYNLLQVNRSFKQIYSLKSLDNLLKNTSKHHPNSLNMKSKVTLYHNGREY